MGSGNLHGVTAEAQPGGSLVCGSPGSHLFQGPRQASRSKATGRGWGQDPQEKQGERAPQERQGEGAPLGCWLLSPAGAWPPRGRLCQAGCHLRCQPPAPRGQAWSPWPWAAVCGSSDSQVSTAV